MPMKLSVGLNKKIGQPDYGRVGAFCSVDVELDPASNHLVTRLSSATPKFSPKTRHIT